MNTPTPFRTPSPGSKPVIAVCGATGLQGGSVVDHLLRDGRFSVRALTRKPTGFRAKELIRDGAIVIEADFGNISSLHSAFEDCHGVFGNTDYFDSFDDEAQHGINIVDACKAMKVKHLVMSSTILLDILKETPVCMHKIKIYNYLKESGVPYTSFSPTFYFNSIFLFDMITKGANGNWVMKFPFPCDVPIPCTSPKDIGAYVLAAFTNPSEWIGQRMWVCNELVTLRHFAETFTEVTGFNVKIHESTREEFYALINEPFVLKLWGGFAFFMENHDQNYRWVSPDIAQRLYPQRQSWREFLTEYSEMPIPQPVAIECYHTRERFGDD